jgi:hypothetical protein
MQELHVVVLKLEKEKMEIEKENLLMHKKNWSYKWSSFKEKLMTRIISLIKKHLNTHAHQSFKLFLF